MSSSGPERSFWDDSRGISALIGAMFLLAFAVILIAMNQAYVVPQENSEIEFQHFQDTRSDMVSVRSSVLTAGQADVSQYATVQLGTNYPPRIFAVNPPPASGTLQTSEPHDIIITNGSDTQRISTRFIEYKPGYNELSVGSTWYENSILYLDETQQGGRIIYEDQQLVTDGNTLRITALQNEFDQSGTGRATLELYPTEAVTADDIPTGDLDITVPTRLTADQYWGDAMQGQSFYDGVTEDDYEPGIHGLEFSMDTTQDSNELQVNTVGIRSEPDEGPAKQNVGSTGDDGSDGSGLPAGKSAFADSNGNGVYDDGETNYTADEVGDNDLKDIDLVIERDVTTDKIEQNKLSSLVIKQGVTVETANKLKFEVNQNGGSIEASGATLRTNNGEELNLKIKKGDGSINIDDANLESDGKITVEIEKEGGSIDASGALLRTNNGEELNLKIKKGDGSINIDDANLESDGKITVEIEKEGGSIDASGALLRTNNGEELKLEIKKGDGDINIEDARLESNGNIRANGDKNGNNELLVNNNGANDGGTYIVEKDGTEATLKTNKITVSGSPEKGTIN